jgi:hypothetical protein
VPLAVCRVTEPCSAPGAFTLCARDEDPLGSDHDWSLACGNRLGDAPARRRCKRQRNTTRRAVHTRRLVNWADGDREKQTRYRLNSAAHAGVPALEAEPCCNSCSTSRRGWSGRKGEIAAVSARLARTSWTTTILCVPACPAVRTPLRRCLRGQASPQIWPGQRSCAFRGGRMPVRRMDSKRVADQAAFAVSATASAT